MARRRLHPDDQGRHRPVIFLTVVIGIASLGNLARAGGLALRALGLLLRDDGRSRSPSACSRRTSSRPGSGFDGEPSDVGARSGQGVDRRGRRQRARAWSASSPTTCCPRASSRRSSRTRSCASSCWRSSSPPSISMLADRQRKAIVSVFEVDLEDRVRRDPADHVGRAAGRLRRHGVHDRGVRRRLADEPRRADGRSSGAPARSSSSWCSARSRAPAGFSIFRLVRLIRDELLIIVGTSSSETVLPRLLAKTQAAGASKQVTRHGPADRLLVQPRRHLHLPDARRAVHRPGDGPGHVDRRADRARRPDDPDLQGRRGDHRRRAGRR